VNDVANDVKLESADAGIVWNTTVELSPDLEVIECPEFESASSEIGIAILKEASQQEVARQFVKFLTHEKIGQAIFKRYGYEMISPATELEVTP